MKVLSIRQLYFKLPDDFQGSLGDALILMAKYHKDKEGANNVTRLDAKIGSKSFNEVSALYFDQFLDAVESGKHLVGLAQITGFVLPEETTNND